MSQNVKIITLGCPKNEVDSEVINKIIHQSGNNVVIDDDEKVDSIIINTCGFISDAVKESKDQIYEALREKEEGKIKKVFVAGCMVKRYKEELEEEFKEVDNFFSVIDFDKIRNEFNVNCSDTENLDRLKTDQVPYAYLKISEGCNYACTFCTIPSIRGSLRSRTYESLIYEANQLVETGVKEIVLISEDTTKYGTDLNEDKNLSKLMRGLNKVDGLKWIKLLYAYPTWVSDDLIDTIAESENICNYIDMPIQHISDKVLKLMKRTYKRKHVEELVAKLRDRIENLIIRSTFIVGFPGETKDDFIQLSDFIQDYAIDRVGVFKYSDEVGTPAELLPKKVDKMEIVDRFEELNLNQDSMYEEMNSKLIGKTMDVLIDTFDEESGEYHGRIYADAPSIDLKVITNSKVNVGDLLPMKINDSNSFELFASI